MAPRILLTGPGYTDRQLASIAAAGYSPVWEAQVSQDELAECLADAVGYVLGGDERLDAQTIALAQDLVAVSFVGTGVGSFIDETAAEEQGLRISTTPGIASRSVAQHAIAMTLALTRGLWSYNDFVKRPADSDLPVTPRELEDLRVGVVGLGHVGRAVASILSGTFDARVAYFSRTRKHASEGVLGIVYLPLEDLIAEVDLLVLAAPYSESTHGLLDVREFDSAGFQYLVNPADARLVDPGALYAALSGGRIRSAAFDGYWTEPPPTPDQDKHGLLRLPDTMFALTPHIAAKSDGAWSRMLDQAVLNVLGLLQA